jgi:type IV pilus assembly protein PilE
MNLRRPSQGFTLIELVVVIVIIGVLASIAFAKYLDLAYKAKQAVTQASLSAVRSTLYMKYAESSGTTNPSFPSSLVASDFATNQLPLNKLNDRSGIATVASAPSGTATNTADGFWYIVATGRAGAYSDGTTDTGGW